MTEQQPLVSIVIPCYNHAQFVQETIQSVIAQDYENIELIIIDDGSKDNSVEVIEKMKPACETRFKRFEFRHRPNKGLCATLNEALEWCEGKYFSAIASDDIALKHKISFLVEKIELDDAHAVFGLLCEFLGSKKFTNLQNQIIKHSFEDLIYQINIPAAPTAMVATSILREVGGYNEELMIEDWYMWLVLAKKGCRLITYPEVVALYRRHDGNATNSLEKMHQGRLAILDLFKDEDCYSTALKTEYLKEARRSAYVSITRTFLFLNKAGWFNKQSVFILIKSMTPKIIIDFKRKLLRQKNL